MESPNKAMGNTNNMCYYISVKDLSNNLYFLQAASWDTFALLSVPAGQKFPPNDDSLLWAPVVLISDSKQGFVLQNIGNNRVIQDNGRGKAVSLISLESINPSSNSVSWSYTSSDHYLESLSDSLVLDVQGSVYQNPTIITWPKNDPSTPNQQWSFVPYWPQ